MSKPNTRAIIDASIKQNGQQLITGQVLNAVLKAMVTDYAEQAALDSLKGKVDALALGAFYGYFPDSDSLPTDVTTPGYAYVGSDNPYEIWNFNGEEWSDSGTSIDMNDADEEDITRNADGKLQFKDRSYGDGMGYIILRKNKTFAEQVTEEDTIYEVRYDFDLDGGDVVVPDGCILRFVGGSVSNGTLTGSDTIIESPNFGDNQNNITLGGTFNSKTKEMSWWGCIPNDINYASHNGNILKAMLPMGQVVVDDIYYISFDSNVNVGYELTICGSGKLIKTTTPYIVPVNGFSLIMEGVSFIHSGSSRYFVYTDTLDFIIDRIIMTGCYMSGIRFIYIDTNKTTLNNDLGINTIIVKNNVFENVSSTFTLLNMQYFKEVEFSGNQFVQFDTAPIYIATSKASGDSRSLLNCPVCIRNNSFLCNAPSTKTTIVYHCAALVEGNIVYFTDNYLDGICSIWGYDGTDGGPSATYDAYLSCVEVYNQRNIIKNLAVWRVDGVARVDGNNPLCEIFKSKGKGQGIGKRYITDNRYIVDTAWLDNNNVPATDRIVGIFRYTSNQDVLVFKNNIIDIPGMSLRGMQGVNAKVTNITFCGNYINSLSYNSLVSATGQCNRIEVVNNTLVSKESSANFFKQGSGEDNEIKTLVVCNNVSSSPMGAGTLANSFKADSVLIDRNIVTDSSPEGGYMYSFGVTNCSKFYCCIEQDGYRVRGRDKSGTSGVEKIILHGELSSYATEFLSYPQLLNMNQSIKIEYYVGGELVSHVIDIYQDSSGIFYKIDGGDYTPYPGSTTTILTGAGFRVRINTTTILCQKYSTTAQRDAFTPVVFTNKFSPLVSE